MDSPLSLEMTLSREEFLRLLPGAVGPGTMSGDGREFQGHDGSRRWVIRLEPLPARCFGHVNLSRHRVEIRLDGYSEAEAAAFMVRFHRGFQRGGG